VFSVQETVTEPGPEPLDGETLSQEPFPEAVQAPPAQPAGRPVMATSCEPAWESAFAEVDERVKLVQVVGTQHVVPARRAMVSTYQPVPPTLASLPRRHRSWIVYPKTEANRLTVIVTNHPEVPLQA
jgi:hypothetical protein